MILVFIYVILIILFLLIFLVLFSSIELHIQNIKYFSDNAQNKNLNKDYNIILRIKLFDKLTYLKFNLIKNKMNNMKKVLNINRLKENFLKNRNTLSSGIFKLTKYWKIKKLDLKLQIGVEDAALNAISVGILSAAIAILLRNFVEKDSKTFWKIVPIYQGRNILKIDIDAIISIKLKDLVLQRKIFNKKKSNRGKIKKQTVFNNKTFNNKNRSKKAS